MSTATRQKIHTLAREFFRLNPELSPSSLPGLMDALPVQIEKRKRAAPSSSSTGRLGTRKSLIQKASSKAGTDNWQFCKLLDQFGVPVPRTWSAKSWLDAYNKPQLRVRIRGVKYRLGSPA